MASSKYSSTPSSLGHLGTDAANGRMFWILAVVVLLAIFLRDLGFVGSLTGMLSLLLSACLLLLRPRFSVALMTMLIPMSTGLQYNLLVIACLAGLILKQATKSRFSPRSLAAVLLLFVAQAIAYGGRGFPVIAYIEHAAIWVLIWMIFCDRSEEYDFALMMKTFLLGGLGLGISLLLQLSQHPNGILFWQRSARLGNTREQLDVDGMVTSVNPNSIAIVCLLACAMLAVHAVLGRRLRGLLLALPYTVLGVMSQSRTFVIGFLCLVVLVVLTAVGRRIRTLLTIIFTVSGLTLALTFFVPEWVGNLVARFTEVDDITNGRESINSIYISAWLESLQSMLFGVGLDGYVDVLGFAWSAHNAILEVLVAWGIIGLIALGMLITIIAAEIITSTKSKPPFVAWVPLVLFGVAMMGSRLIGTPLHLLLLIPCLAVPAAAMQLMYRQDCRHAARGPRHSMTFKVDRFQVLP